MHLVCRNRERGEAAISEIKSSTGNPNVFLEVRVKQNEWIFIYFYVQMVSDKMISTFELELYFCQICDLSSMADIKSFVSRVSSRNEPVHVLV